MERGRVFVVPCLSCTSQASYFSSNKRVIVVYHLLASTTPFQALAARPSPATNHPVDVESTISYCLNVNRG
jgi:hypothetical protein